MDVSDTVKLLRMLPKEKMENFFKTASDEVVKEINDFLDQPVKTAAEQEEETRLTGYFEAGQALGIGFINALRESGEKKEG